MRLYLAILPPENITNDILRARERLGIETQNPPHVTLRSSFTTESYEALIDELQTIRTPPLTVTFEGYTLFDDQFLVLLAQKTPELMDLEARVLRIAEHHRISEEKPLRRPLEGRELEYLSTYGDPFVFERYTPHLTLAYEKPENCDVSRILELPISFSANSIAVIEKPDYEIRDRIPLVDEKQTI
jgi:2'-5' RNA ligase